jgi:hypothetical protein
MTKLSNFNHGGKGLYHENTNVMAKKEISNFKRYLISTIRIFVAVFVAHFAVALQSAVTEGAITTQVLTSLAWGAFASALNFVAKAAQERYNGLI